MVGWYSCGSGGYSGRRLCIARTIDVVACFRDRSPTVVYWLVRKSAGAAGCHRRGWDATPCWRLCLGLLLGLGRDGEAEDRYSEHVLVSVG